MLNHVRRSSVAVVAALVLGVSPAFGGVPAPDLGAAIRSSLQVSSYTLQRFEAPASSAAGFRATFRLGDRSYSFSVTPDEINAPDSVMELYSDEGETQVLPAPPSHIFTGEVEGVEGSSVTAQLIGGRLNAMILLRSGREAWFVQPLSDVTPNAGVTEHVVYSADALVPDGSRCGNDDHHHLSPLLAQGSAGGVHGTFADGPLRCQIAVEADFQFFQLNGSNASATAQDIAKVMAYVRNWYIAGANVTFTITRYIIRTTSGSNPYSSNDAGVLLDQVRAQWAATQGSTVRDIGKLFTGRDLVGSTIGLGYVGVVCSQTFGFSLSQNRFTTALGKRASVASHEIGHNFNASHCNTGLPTQCAPCAIMLSQMGTSAAQVTTLGCSGTVIAGYALGRSCLEPTDGTGGFCRADLNGDGTLDLADFGAFQAAFGSGDLGHADFNGDGLLTLADFGAFQTAFALGCH